MDEMKYGFRIGDRYVCRKALGRGGSGTVFLAYDEKLDKHWAVKACDRYSKQETEALKRVDHYVFPRIVDVIRQDDRDYLVMDYVEGETLTSYIAKHAVNERTVLNWADKIAGAIEYLHNQDPVMLYMDCKPDNIMITLGGDIRLVDMGSVYVCDPKSDNIVSGTGFFAPDEVRKRRGKGQAPDERSDVYSFGMTLYFLLTGSKQEYRDKGGGLCLRKCNRNISPAAEYFVRKCTARRPGDRFQSFEELRKELKYIQKHKRGLSAVFKQVFDGMCKSVLALLVLMSAERYVSCKDKDVLALMLILFAVFLSLCKSRQVYTWETKKDVFRGAGRRLVMIAVCVICRAGTKASAAERLDVTLYDGYGRKLLVRPGAVWEIKDDIAMSLNRMETAGEECLITITCDSESGVKSYSFLCTYDNSENSESDMSYN
ncbi:MAG: serine/threonine protein kinase [Lachnospiraceae bacterium]|nr:serine/threonine protein kinase [Lachnospiraceae bacterium]